VSHSTTAAIVCLSMISISYFAAAAIIWSIPPAYLDDAAAPAGIGVISSLGQVGAFCGPIALGWIKTVTGSLSIGLAAIAALVVLGGLAVLLGVPASSLREKAQQS
jgi:ACS family phthalate transporter-like MFS transporter